MVGCAGIVDLEVEVDRVADADICGIRVRNRIRDRDRGAGRDRVRRITGGIEVLTGRECRRTGAATAEVGEAVTTREVVDTVRGIAAEDRIITITGRGATGSVVEGKR